MMPFEKAARLMILQNPMGLDIIFAAKSGLCGVIATSECYTYLLSIDSNLSTAVQHMKDPQRGLSPSSL